MFKIDIGKLHIVNKKCGYGKPKNRVKFNPRVTGHVVQLGTVPKLLRNVVKMQ